MAIYRRALWQLIRFHYYVLRRDFALLRQKVREYPCSSMSPHPRIVARVCRAMDLICFYYPQHALCLQRSAATACLLRQCGVRAELVIGARQIPFRAHAWVEVDGVVVNDKPYVRDKFQVLDQC